MRKSTRSRATTARPPGFRGSGPGKVPSKVVRQRFRDQILHDVAHGLIPRAVDEALRERGVEPVDTPDIKDVVVEEGQPLKFTATFDTVPPIDPGDYATIRLKRGAAAVDDAAVDQALAGLRERGARYEPVENRGVENGRLGADGSGEDDGGGDPDGSMRTTRARSRAEIGQPSERHGGHRREREPAGLRQGAGRADAGRGRRRSTCSIRPTTRSPSSPGRP